MPVVIDATIGGESANSYITLVDAESYFEERMPAASNWLATVSDDDKNRALVTATRLLDKMVVWDGLAASDTQALLWPRLELYDAKGVEIEDDAIPVEIGYAVCELADSLLGTDRTDDLTTQGIEGMDVGDIGIKFSSSAPPQRRVLPELVWEFVRLWCKARIDGGGGQAKLARA